MSALSKIRLVNALVFFLLGVSISLHGLGVAGWPWLVDAAVVASAVLLIALLVDTGLIGRRGSR